MNSALVLDKRVSLTYTHSTSLFPPPAPAAAPPSRTALDCSVTFDPANKVNFSHSLGSGGCRVKYTYAHGVDRLTTIEPLFDTNKNAWEFALTKKFQGGDAVKGTYHASTKLLGLEWSRDSKAGGSFKVSTTFLLLFFWELLLFYSCIHPLTITLPSITVCFALLWTYYYLFIIIMPDDQSLLH